MGGLLSCCADGKEEKNKPKLLGDVPQASSGHESSLYQDEQDPNQQQQLVDTDPSSEHEHEATTTVEAERALRQEQARLELIVSDAGRSMVAVRSTRANHDYYDQGFAAALAQHLQEQIGNKTTNLNTLPKVTPNINVHDTLNSNPWQNVQLGEVVLTNETDANAFVDSVAESFLASAVPTKEQLFNQVEPMVENLL